MSLLSILEHGRCRYCRRPVVWGVLRSGFHRAFQPELRSSAEVAEADRYAVSTRYRAVVDLIGETNPPPRVLVQHLCSEYAEAMRMRGVSSLADTLGAIFGRAGAA